MDPIAGAEVRPKAHKPFRHGLLCARAVAIYPIKAAPMADVVFGPNGPGGRDPLFWPRRCKAEEGAAGPN